MAQAPSSEASPALQALLSEVHQLRLALERSNQIAPRIQIAVGRIKIQQEQVTRSANRLDDARRELDHLRTEQLRFQQEMERAQNALNETTEQDRRKELAGALEQMKLQVEVAEKSVQQLQVRESEAEGQLQMEQGKLAELNERLNQIERALSHP